MSKQFKVVLCVITLFFSSLSLASTTWIPIIAGDITTFIPYTPNEPFEAPNNIQLSVTGNVKTLSWNDVEHGSRYQIQALNQQGVWVDIVITDALSITIDSRFSGYTSVRVIACTLNSCSNTGAFSEQISLVLDSNTSKNIATSASPVLANAPALGAIGDVIRTLGGEFKVNESGSATYNVPINLPQGIAGVSPSLTFNYSSGAGNGVMGVGWSLNGTSSIMRCRQTKQHEGRITPLKMNSDDRFCLDNQKLIAVSGEYGDNATQYRTEIDNQTRITSYGTLGSGPAYFTVERVDGSISYYGNDGSYRYSY